MALIEGQEIRAAVALGEDDDRGIRQAELEVHVAVEHGNTPSLDPMASFLRATPNGHSPRQYDVIGSRRGRGRMPNLCDPTSSGRMLSVQHAPGQAGRSSDVDRDDSDEAGSLRADRRGPRRIRTGTRRERGGSAESVIGEVGGAFDIAMASINWTRMRRGGMCSGWGQLLIHRMVERAKSRVIGGKPLGANQGIAWMVADSYADWMMARSLSLSVARELDHPGPWWKTPRPREEIRKISAV